jgi:hypothetical protein
MQPSALIYVSSKKGKKKKENLYIPGVGSIQN